MRAAFSKSDNPLLQAAQQALKQQLGLAEAVFGQPQTFTPSATHVFLVALMICIIVNRR